MIVNPKVVFFISFLIMGLQKSGAQPSALSFSSDTSLVVSGYSDGNSGSTRFSAPLPLFSFRVNGQNTTCGSVQFSSWQRDTLQGRIGDLKLEVTPLKGFVSGAKMAVRITNTSNSDTLSLDNFVPLGEDASRVYITGLGDHPLSRAHLFQPGLTPVNVILPDNAWELGYSGVVTGQNSGICALMRRTGWSEKARRRRFETILYPGGSVTYQLWADEYVGNWQEGLRRMFQERYLYDLEGKTFDETLYRRPDLHWIRKAFAMHLIMAWDRDFYDPSSHTYQLEAFLKRMSPLLGKTDVVGIWPNWPMLGLDQRNQWDLFRDLPGGLVKVKEQATMARRYGTKFFISYNPWDESTRWEDHHAGMSDMIRQLDADGVVLDTEGKSSPERQQAADAVKPGVIMYSEGMAVPKDMPGIVSGRVHNALYYPPILNLNKFIRPDFAIFRVAELFKEPIKREFSLSLFNGYGTEINQFQPGRPDWMEEQYRYWGKILLLQRQNASIFTVRDMVPLWPSLKDQVYLNCWPKQDKTVFTIFSLLPGGHEGPLFRFPVQKGRHLVDLWNHTLLRPDTLQGEWIIPVSLEGFSEKWLGSNNEGAVGAIAILPEILKVSRNGDLLTIDAPEGGDLLVWAGPPAYDKVPLSFPPGGTRSIDLSAHFGHFEGKFIIQYLRDGELADEQIVEIPASLARMTSRVEHTAPAAKAPEGMVMVPGGPFIMKVTFGDNFIPHPAEYPTGEFQVPGFYMDKYPVTNADFREFLRKSRYVPEDTSNFLKHWKNGKIPVGEELFPVTYVSYEDAKAYALWAGKRLPTEIEWQFAAQTPDLRAWPWGKEAQVERSTQTVTATLTVSSISADSAFCNPGNGKLYPVGTYAKGANPYGLEDLTGCVWQLTNDVYMNGANTFLILKGGSYYRAASSWWYVEGGPRELTYSQKLMRIGPGFERNATTGFRCVKDAPLKN